MADYKATVMGSAVLARCPRCGKGPLFRQVLVLREKCSCCRTRLCVIDTGDGPAVFAIFIWVLSYSVRRFGSNSRSTRGVAARRAMGTADATDCA